MNKFIIAACIAAASFAASAQCTGSGSFQYCTDASGNTYSVTRSGSSTYVSGSNPQTGSNWNQETHRLGNSSYTTGRDASGNTWGSDTHRSPTGSTTYSRDANGNTSTRVCNQFGCF